MCIGSACADTRTGPEVKQRWLLKPARNYAKPSLSFSSPPLPPLRLHAGTAQRRLKGCCARTTLAIPSCIVARPIARPTFSRDSVPRKDASCIRFNERPKLPRARDSRFPVESREDVSPRLRLALEVSDSEGEKLRTSYYERRSERRTRGRL